MDEFTETTTVVAGSDGFIAIAVDRKYEDDVGYRSALYVQPGDAAAIADALERFAETRLDQTVTLADGQLRIFDMAPSQMINIELERTDDGPHGGYDTMDLGPGSAAGVVSGLRSTKR